MQVRRKRGVGRVVSENSLEIDSMDKDTFYGLFIAFVVLLGIGGWVNNIVTLFGLDGMSGEMVLRVVGIFVAPLGAVLGYF
jgi:hypothetical protein